MKKFLLSLLIICFIGLGGMYIYKQMQPAPATQSSNLSEKTPAEVTTSVTTATIQIEETLTPSTYPLASFPQDINQEDLLSAMTAYFHNDFTAEEQTNTTQQLSKLDLQSLRSTLNQQTAFQPLRVDVDQIALHLGDSTVYVARLIIPMSYQSANQLVPDHDIQLMNHTFSVIGNRLVMVAYYDAAQGTLTPRHIASSTKSLFYAED